jgi:hypothetical protein
LIDSVLFTSKLIPCIRCRATVSYIQILHDALVIHIILASHSNPINSFSRYSVATHLSSTFQTDHTQRTAAPALQRTNNRAYSTLTYNIRHCQFFSLPPLHPGFSAALFILAVPPPTASQPIGTRYSFLRGKAVGT